MPEHQHKGHRQRLRTRFLSSSLASFAPHEILELLLSYCIPQANVNPLAHKLIERFGSVAKVLDASPEELQSVPGIGAASAEFLKLLPVFTDYYLFDKRVGKQWLLTPFGLSEYCAALFEDGLGSDMLIITLNVHGELLGHRPMTPTADTKGETLEYQRIAANMAIQSNAYAIVLAHLHADGSIEPDDFDIKLLCDLRISMETIGVLLLDIIIIGDDDSGSMSIHNYIKSSNRLPAFVQLYIAAASSLLDIDSTNDKITEIQTLSAD